MKYLDYINDDEIDMLEMLFGALMIYDVNDEGQQVNKKMVTIDSLHPMHNLCHGIKFTF